MKRLLLIALAALLLTGCAKENPSAQIGENHQTEETSGLYIPNSSVEQETGGAVRTYALEYDTYFGLYSVGSHLVLMGQKGMTALTGEQCQVSAVLETGDVRSNSIMDIAATGVAYYLPNARQVVVRNPQLHCVIRLDLPKEIVGNPAISIVKNEVYYCTETEIRALNMSTGISRLLRHQSAVTQNLLCTCFDGTVLVCEQTDADGLVTTEFLSTETGQTLGKGKKLSQLETCADRYFASWQDGVVLETAFGTRGGQVNSLVVPRPEADVGGRAAVTGMNGIVDYTMTESGLELTYYALDTGKRTARIVLSGLRSPTAFCSDGAYVWIVATDADGTRQVLCRWDVTRTPVEDEQNYLCPLYTAENPDTEGLKQLRELVNTYEKKYGVKLLFAEDAVKHTGEYAVVAEHHPHIIQERLEALLPLLEQFPERFLLKTVEAGWIKIALVQDIAGESDWAQYWEDGDCWVLLSIEADLIPSLLKGIAYGIDSHILGNSRDFDGWEQLNPEGFAYTLSDTEEGDPQYLSGENQAFTDAAAMTYPHEDRCRIFYHAMLPDNAAMFQSETMQAKLMRVCTGIREAYGLEKNTVTYPWEQYLQTSLAYVKE